MGLNNVHSTFRDLNNLREKSNSTDCFAMFSSGEALRAFLKLVRSLGMLPQLSKTIKYIAHESKRTKKPPVADINFPDPV